MTKYEVICFIWAEAWYLSPLKVICKKTEEEKKNLAFKRISLTENICEQTLKVFNIYSMSIQFAIIWIFSNIVLFFSSLRFLTCLQLDFSERDHGVLCTFLVNETNIFFINLLMSQ